MQTLIYISILAEELISQLFDSQVKYISDIIRNKSHELMHQNRIIDLPSTTKVDFGLRIISNILCRYISQASTK